MKLIGLKINLMVGFAKYWLYFPSEYKRTNKQTEHIRTKGFINLQFLQKLSSQKPFWDEARLYSLVNKKFARTLTCKEWRTLWVSPLTLKKTASRLLSLFKSHSSLVNNKEAFKCAPNTKKSVVATSIISEHTLKMVNLKTDQI